MGVFIFQKSPFSEEDKRRINVHTGGTGLKKRRQRIRFLCDYFCIVQTQNSVLLHKKTVEFVYCKLYSKHLKFDDKYRQQTQS